MELVLPMGEKDWRFFSSVSASAENTSQHFGCHAEEMATCLYYCCNCNANCQCLISAKDLRGQWLLKSWQAKS